MTSVKRVASVIRLNPEGVEEYERLHANAWPEVLKKITECNIRNYSIYRYGLLLFSYFEYVGDDMDADMALMGEDQTTQDWWAVASHSSERSKRFPRVSGGTKSPRYFIMTSAERA